VRLESDDGEIPEPASVTVASAGELATLAPRNVRRLWQFVLVGGAMAITCLVAGRVYVSGDGMMSAALAAAAVAHWSSRPTRAEAVATLALTVAFVAFGGEVFALGGVEPHFDRVVSALGLAGLVVQVARFVRAPEERASERGGFVALTMLTPMFSLAFASSIGLPGVLHGRIYDALVLRFDRLAAFGHLPPVVVGQWLVRHRWVAACASFCYWAPQPLNILVYVAERRRRSPRDLVTTLAICGFSGLALFSFFPVVGPGYVLPGFPFVASGALPVIGTFPVDVPRNCMPSLHMTEAIIVGVHVWRFAEARWRALAIVNFGLTVVATLGFGYHYLADLVAAFPFAYAVLGASRRDGRAAGVGAVLTVGFLVLLRFGFGSP
jgi:hypothetical protein